MRESLFAWLDICAGAAVLDLYAGCGALGIEALSRGAAAVVFVERAPTALKLLSANLEALGLHPRCEIRRGDALRVLRRMERSAPRFDLALVDPPYRSDELARVLPVLAEGPLLSEGGVIAVERSWRRPLPELSGLRVFRTQRYGETAIDALRRVPVD